MKNSPEDRKPGSSFLISFELMQLGYDLVRHKIRRQNPEASEEEIEELFVEHYKNEPLNRPGVKVSWPITENNKTRL